MSEEYLFAVQRAELLGQTPPSEEEWAASNEINIEIKENDDNVAQNLNEADETGVRIGGGLDELNSILSATQRKINRFKTVCGSLGNLLKVRVTSRDNSKDDKSLVQINDNQDKLQNIDNQAATSNAHDDDDDDDDNNMAPCVSESRSITNKKIDINEKMGSHLDKLDSMITKAERAQGKMQHQTQQMKKIISK